jgi:hypothetical protein
LTVVIGASAYKAWDPTQRQEREPDTRYMQDMAVEATLTPWEGGMLGGNEVSGLTIDKPSWRGGSACEVVAGKYRDGIRAVGGRYVILPASGVWPTGGQWTWEFFVSSDIAWSSLSTAQVVQLWNDYSQLMKMTVNAGTITTVYQHDHDPTSVFKQVSIASQTFAAGAWVSIALTLAANTLRIYVDGVLKTTTTGCTSPRLWNDNWNAPYGGLWIATDAHLSLSDMRISALARTPGQVPV